MYLPLGFIIKVKANLRSSKKLRPSFSGRKYRRIEEKTIEKTLVNIMTMNMNIRVLFSFKIFILFISLFSFITFQPLVHNNILLLVFQLRSRPEQNIHVKW